MCTPCTLGLFPAIPHLPLKLLTDRVGDSGSTGHAHSADENVLCNTGQLHSLLLLLCHSGTHASRLLPLLLLP